MTERDAKAAVREYLEPFEKGFAHYSPQLRKLYAATHAWANSPDGPDALNAANMEDTLRFYRLQSLERTIVDALTQEGIAAWPGDATSCVEQIVRVQYDRAEAAEKALAEFKARVRAAIENFCVEYWDDKDWRGRFFPGSYMQKHFAPILAECEPPAPPKPKFAVGTVVVDLLLGMPHKITSCADGVCEMTDSSTWPENRIREQTPEEKG